MKSIAEFLGVLKLNGSESLETLREALAMLDEATSMPVTRAELLCHVHDIGPVIDGHEHSALAREKLLASGYLVRVVYEGKDGWLACSHPGAWMVRLLRALGKIQAILVPEVSEGRSER